MQEIAGLCQLHLTISDQVPPSLTQYLQAGPARGTPFMPLVAPPSIGTANPLGIGLPLRNGPPAFFSFGFGPSLSVQGPPAQPETLLTSIAPTEEGHPSLVTEGVC